MAEGTVSIHLLKNESRVPFPGEPSGRDSRNLHSQVPFEKIVCSQFPDSSLQGLIGHLNK